MRHKRRSIRGRSARGAAAVALGLIAATTLFTPEARAEKKHRIEWSYPRFRGLEYLAAGFVTGALLYVETATRGVPDNNFKGGILLDNWTRRTLVASTASGRQTAASISDALWNPTQYFPIIDSLITPLLTDGWNVDAAVQMTLINWQVQGAAALITRATHRTVGRTRPILADCAENPGYDDLCKPGYHSGVNESFLSGHTSMSFAGAALTCSHHIALPLYGGNAFDAAICALSLTSATTIGVLRVVADKHWLSDVMAGATVGLATGFGLPFLLHYTRKASPNVAFLPLVGPTTTGLSMIAIQ